MSCDAFLPHSHWHITSQSYVTLRYQSLSQGCVVWCVMWCGCGVVWCGVAVVWLEVWVDRPPAR